ncbi:MAG: hypothetical protein PHV05_04645, partial [Candidatus Riflebacteria bacterium]|nr:hypothetical protein [Candidatus Riflebacteria bacterium]
MLTLKNLQEQHKEWQEKNFGASPSWHALLGIQEEVGELSYAHLECEHKIPTIEKIDAVGDVIIYLTAYCNLEGIDLQQTVGELTREEQRKEYTSTPSWRLLLAVQKQVGKLSHAHLKSLQGIRTNENHQTAKTDAIGDIIIYLSFYCALEGINLQQAIEQTWAEVSQRNWKTNQVNGKLPEAQNDDEARVSECLNCKKPFFKKKNSHKFCCYRCGNAYWVRLNRKE